MKKIEAIIRTDKLEDLKDAFVSLDAHPGMTVAQVLGYGKQKGFVEYIRGQKVVTKLLAKVKVEIVCKDTEVDNLVDTIVKAVRTGEVGDGKIFITDVERSIRIRTGEEDEDAL